MQVWWSDHFSRPTQPAPVASSLHRIALAPTLECSPFIILLEAMVALCLPPPLLLLLLREERGAERREALLLAAALYLLLLLLSRDWA